MGASGYGSPRDVFWERNMPLACLHAVSVVTWEYRSRVMAAVGSADEAAHQRDKGVRWISPELKTEMHERFRKLLAGVLSAEGFVYVDEQGVAKVRGRRQRPDLVVVVDPVHAGDGPTEPLPHSQILAYSRSQRRPVAAVVGDFTEDELYAAVLHPYEARHAVRCGRGKPPELLNLNRGKLFERVRITSSQPLPIERFLPVASPGSPTVVPYLSSLTLCQVAAGVIDAFVDMQGGLTWDLLPGRLVLAAAEGAVVGLGDRGLPWPDLPPNQDLTGHPGGRSIVTAQPFIAASHSVSEVLAGCLAHGSPALVRAVAPEERYPLVPTNLRLPLHGRPLSDGLARALRRARLVPRQSSVELGSIGVMDRDHLVKDVAAWVRQHRDDWLDQPLCPEGRWPDGLTLEQLEPDHRLIRWLRRTGLEGELSQLAKLPMTKYLEARCGGVESLVRFGRAFDHAVGSVQADAPATWEDPGPWHPGDGYDAEFVSRHGSFLTDCLEPRPAAVVRARTGIGTMTERPPTYKQIAQLLVDQGIDQRVVTPSRIRDVMSAAESKVWWADFDTPDLRWLRARLRSTAWSREPAVTLTCYAREGLAGPPSTLVPHLLDLMRLTHHYKYYLDHQLSAHLSRNSPTPVPA